MNPTAGQDSIYLLLRHLTLPIVALTTSAGGRSNGMIANSAQRASLLPARPRVSLYMLKTHYSHELVMASGVFALHLLRADQWDLIGNLGLRTGRGSAKLEGLAVRRGASGCPLLPEHAAAFECRVVNSMDAGYMTFFLANVVAVHSGEGGPVMTSEHFRANAPEALRQEYEARLAETQRRLEAGGWEVKDPAWQGPSLES